MDKRDDFVAFILFLGMLIVIAVLSGCASIPDLTTADSYGEGAFQAEHLVDTVQTMHGAGEDRCFSEGDPMTRAMIGAHPSQGAVVAWGVGFAAVHFGITSWLLENGHDRIAAVWEAASIIDTAAIVNHNYSIGIRLGAPNVDDAACIKYYGGTPPPPTTTYLHIQH